MSVNLIFNFVLLILVLLALSFGVRLYSLLRTGELGKSWQFVVWGVVFLVLREILRVGNLLAPIPEFFILEKICEVGFVTLLCFGLWRQWSTFDFLQARRRKRTHWNQIARSISSMNERQKDETKESEETKEWREEWFRKV